ncbi:glycoside hydrolase family 97 protein [Filimonas effusa]|uniref:Glycoside hydrolase family 97 protein n=1 Tax=Filimonas effusa TaxID=2508721 RepID=A0A4Q1DCY8_9BACT|nr:glycoside hydrolase family 97 protein [Filimonas effusa]
MIRSIAIVVITLLMFGAKAQQLTVSSPNQKISVSLVNLQNAGTGEWYLKIAYAGSNNKTTEAISRIDLGLVLNNQDYAKELHFVSSTKPVLIREQYTALHGKKSQRSNLGNEAAFAFENKSKSRLNLLLRVYNDGVAFRYALPGKQGSYTVNDELTSFTISPETTRWMEKWNPANEGLYTAMSNDKVQQQEWCYPALFNTGDSSCWFLLHESDVNRNYCGSKLSNTADKSKYKVTFPDPKDGRGKGEALPTISLPWQSPWRVIIMGSLADVVASTLVEDVAPASSLQKTDWIKPGLVSWNYWSDNHGTKDFKTVCHFTDLAAAMKWPYTLFDWEWDAMGNGGNLEDAIKYSLSKGIKPLIWYNSGGDHTWVSATPKDRMLTHENRVAEFTKLRQLGVAGVKIDFFESEKQDMIRYYLDILEDAAQFEIMVYFHGCIVPRGWSRTYPHLMTYEAVRGAEWYNNGPEFTFTAPEHNTILPFTRNVVGPMDYTPVTFTNSQFPHLTSYGHELALSVLFESSLQHLADRPEGYYDLPDAPKSFLKEIPTCWDETKLIDGYPGKDVTIARRKENNWYIGGINAEIREKRKTIPLSFLTSGKKYKLTLLADGNHDKDFKTSYSVVDSNSTFPVKLLRRGGFAALLTLVQ